MIVQAAKEFVKESPLAPFLRPKRRFHVFGVGTAKSGTTSLAAMFRQYRTAHEIDADRTIAQIIAHETGEMSDEDFARFVRQQDRKYWLEFNSSQLNFFLLDQILEFSDNATFVLTIRDPISWVNSFINHQINNPIPDDSPWQRLRDMRFQPERYAHAAEELVLKENGLYTLDGYLTYWRQHNKTIIDKVPESRLLIVRTDRLSSSLQEVANFVRVPLETIRADLSHSHIARANHDLISKIDKAFINEKLRQHCADLIAAYFPDLSANAIG